MTEYNVLKFSDIKNHPNLSLSPSDYTELLLDQNKVRQAYDILVEWKAKKLSETEMKVLDEATNLLSDMIEYQFDPEKSHE